MEILPSPTSPLPARQLRKAALPGLWLKLPGDTPGACTERPANRLGTPIALHLFTAQEWNTHIFALWVLFASCLLLLQWFTTHRTSAPEALLLPHLPSCTSCHPSLYLPAAYSIALTPLWFQILLFFSSELSSSNRYHYHPLLHILITPTHATQLPAFLLPSTLTGQYFSGFEFFWGWQFIKLLKNDLRFGQVTTTGLLFPSLSLFPTEFPTCTAHFHSAMKHFFTWWAHKTSGNVLESQQQAAGQRRSCRVSNRDCSSCSKCGMPFTLQFLMLIIQSPFCHMLLQGKFLCRLSSPDSLAETFYNVKWELKRSGDNGKEVHNTKDKPKHVWYRQSYWEHIKSVQRNLREGRQKEWNRKCNTDQYLKM